MKKITQAQISEAIETSYNFEDVFKTKSGRLIYVFDDLDGLIEVEIVPNATPDQAGLMGVHLTEIENETDLQFRLSSALHDCFRDGFGTIYLHSGRVA